MKVDPSIIGLQEITVAGRIKSFHRGRGLSPTGTLENFAQVLT